jgi:hypothetical protein
MPAGLFGTVGTFHLIPLLPQYERNQIADVRLVVCA